MKMYKYSIAILLSVFMCMLFTTCALEDIEMKWLREPDKPAKQPIINLAGTEWEATDDNNFIFVFVDNTEWEFYQFSDGVRGNLLSNGTYTKSGNKITIKCIWNTTGDGIGYTDYIIINIEEKEFLLGEIIYRLKKDENPYTSPVVTITSQPAKFTTVYLGDINDNDYLEVIATVPIEATLQFQWYTISHPAEVIGTAISGQSNPRFYLSATLTEGEYYYYCEVRATGGAQPVRSDVAIVVVDKTGGKLLIFQANRAGNDSGGASGFPKALVELYNNTSGTIDLTTGNYYLFIGSATAWTYTIKLEGNIPAKSSFLIVSLSDFNTAGNYPDLTPVGRAILPTPDMIADFNFPTTNNWKVALMKNLSTLTVNNPFTETSLAQNYIDMLGAGNTGNGFETARCYPVTQPQGPRRNSLTDTDHNNNDFSQVDYRGRWPSGGNGMPNEDLYKFWPRNSTSGPWNPISGFPAIHPTVRNPTTGAVQFP